MNASKVGFVLIAMIASVLFATSTQAIVVADLLGLATPAPYQLSPNEMEEKYGHLVKMEEPYKLGKRNCKITSFHTFSTMVIKKETKWKTVVTATHTIHRKPTAWIKWVWTETQDPTFGTLGYYQPIGCWELLEGKLIQSWSNKGAL